MIKIETKQRLFVILQIIGLFVGYLFIGSGIMSLIDNNILSTIIVSVLLSGVLIVTRFFGQTSLDIKHTPDFAKTFVLVFLAGALEVVCSSFAVWYYTKFGDVGLDMRSTVISDNLVLYLMLSLIIAPVFEELVMRRFMYVALKKSFNLPTALLFSSIIFAAMHGTVVHMFIGLIFGLYMCLIYEYTGDIKYPILTHVLYNAMTLFR